MLVLDRVEITNVGTGAVSVFPAIKPDGTPVATATADNQWTVTLNKKLPDTDYKVSSVGVGGPDGSCVTVCDLRRDTLHVLPVLQIALVTSNVADGAFDGNVFITLSGSEGKSDEVRRTPARITLPSTVHSFSSASLSCASLLFSASPVSTAPLL